MAAPEDLAQLDRESYLSLSTTRRNGTAVATPVWFAVDGDTIVVSTGATSGKVKRLRNDPTVTVTPCNARGGTHGAARTGTAVIVTGDDPLADRSEQLLARKYGLVWRAFHLVDAARRFVLRKPEEPTAHLVITLDPVPVDGA